MQLLSAHPSFRDVRAPSAAMRPPGATKDTFNIELMLDPKAFAPKASAASVVDSAAVKASPAAAPASAPVSTAVPSKKANP
ncbi:hypothetical protein D3C71_1799140 [compost metagenome]